jgi:Mg2+/Co2+ transporter CorB
MIVHYLEEIPKKNSNVLIEKFVLTVLSVTDTKIEEVKVSINEK